MKKSIEIIGKNRKALNLCLIIANLAVLAILGFVLFQHQNSKVNRMVKTPKNEQVSKGSSSSSKEAKKEDKTQLKKGSNHSIEASDYAYDVTAVNNTIRGKSDDVKGKVVFLTFDDGIDPTLTPQVMDILKEYGVHATFFHIGYTITSENGDILKRQITEDMSLPTTVLAIISICSIQDVFQIKVKLFLRLTKPMPISKPSQVRISKQDVQWIDWNTLCVDAEPLSVRPTTSESMMAYMDDSQKYFPETTVKVVLMHDTAGKELTVQTLPQIIEYFKNQGYTFGVLE